MKKLAMLFTMLSLVLGVFFNSLAQTQLQLGDLSYIRAEAPRLTRPVRLTGGFFRAVGGVAFHAVAESDDGWRVTNLDYVASNADGQRLAVTLQNDTGSPTRLYGDVYDWQLVPIAEFAASEDGAALTLFGELKNAEFANQIVSEGGRVINYHQAFDNTLLGLRMLQADVLLFQPNATDLFRDANGYILGTGEPAHDQAPNQTRFRQMRDWLEEQQLLGNSYQSYVVGDLNQKVTFTVNNQQLQFSGQPYWTMWRSPEQYQQDLDIFRTIGRYIELSEQDENALTTSDLLELINLTIEIEDMIEKGVDLEAVFARVETYDPEEAEVQVLQEFSDMVSGKVAELQGINPVIYYNLKTVMHYSALFRHFKRHDPASYAAFVDSLQGVQVSPAVQTPTVQQ